MIFRRICFTRSLLDCEDLWSGIILEPCGKRDVIQNSSRHGWWVLSFHTIMPRVFTTSTRCRFNSSWCNSRRNCDRTSTTIYCGENLGNLRNWNWKFCSEKSGTKFLGYALPRNESLHGWRTCSKVGIQQRQQGADHRKSRWNDRTLFCGMDQSRTEETCVEGSDCHEEPLCYTKSTIATRERESRKLFLNLLGPINILETAIWKFVTKLSRHCGQEERESDGAVRWDSVHSRLLKQFCSRSGQNCSQRDWLQAIHEGSNKTRFEYCKNSIDHVIYVRAIQGPTDGNMISPELMGHVKIPYGWKEFVFHRGFSYDMKSILDKKLEDRQFSSQRPQRLLRKRSLTRKP